MAKADLGKIVLTVGDWSPAGWIEHLKTHLAPEDIYFSDGQQLPDKEERAKVRYAVAWHTPPGFFAHFPALRAVLSTGAGVDHLVGREDLAPDVAIIRVIDPDLTGRVTAWTVMNVIAHHRQMLDYWAAQQERVWRPLKQTSAPDVRVGIMGYGALGQSVARSLTPLDYDLAAWARTRKADSAIPVYVGWGELEAFLNRTDILVCLLPLTAQTRGILNTKLFQTLAQDGAMGGPILINAGRGAHQVEEDVVQALQTGLLKGASIDVFHQEPLPPDHPLWSAPNLLITPHTAGMSAPEALVGRMVENLIAFAEGRPLDNVVDRTTGY